MRRLNRDKGRSCNIKVEQGTMGMTFQTETYSEILMELWVRCKRRDGELKREEV